MILLTGGSGRLGRELRTLLDDVVAPPRAELDVTREKSVVAALDRYEPDVVVHAAAYTDVGGAERERQVCWGVNVVGTRNLVRALAGRACMLVHISTDYVFEGVSGGYAEDALLGPPRNFYALSKLAAEEVARCAPRCVVLRTSFRPREWPYPVAFTDVYTSQDYVDVVAPEIALAIRQVDRIPFDTLHIATERKSVFELARRRAPEVRPASKRNADVDLPDDVSLDTTRWQTLKQGWSER